MLVRPRVVGQNSQPWNDKPRTYPINFGETGRWRDSVDLSLPAGYVVDDMPEPVHVDVGFASYTSQVKQTPGVLHYTREYIVRDLDVSPDQYVQVRKLMGAMTADENNNAVLKKK